MRSGLLILPFLALLVAALGMAFGSSFPEAAFLRSVGLAVAGGMLALWVVLDWEGFKAFFSRKGAKYGASSGIVILLGVAVIVGVAVITSKPRFNKTWDLTRDRLNTLSEQSVKLVDTIKKDGKEIRMTAFFSDDQAQTQFKDIMALYQGLGANFAIEYVDPAVNPTRAMAEKVTDPNTVIVRQGQQEKRLTTFNEERIANALVNVLKDRAKKVYFTKGHGEGAMRGTEAQGYSALVTELENDRMAVEELSLLEAAKVPEDADAIVVAGPRYDFAEEEIRILEDYMKRGGAALVMLPAMTQVDNLGRMLERFGVRLNTDLLILAPNDPRAQLLGQNLAIVSEFDDFHPVTKEFSASSSVAVALRHTRSVDAIEDNPHQLKVTLAAKTSDVIVRVKDVREARDLDNLTEDRWDLGSYPVLAIASGKAPAPATAQAGNQRPEETRTDAGATGDAQQTSETRLVVVGSNEFAMNQGAQHAANRDLFLNIVNYLLQDEDFITIRPKDPTKSTIDVTTGSSQLLLMWFAFIYPFVFLGAGTVAWLRRRRA